MVLLWLLCWGSVFPPNNIEIINGDLMTSDVAMVIDWGGCLLMFSEPLSKCSWGFTYVFLIAVNPATLISIDDPTLFQDWILILWGHQEAFDGIACFKVHLHTMFATDLFEAFTHTLVIWYHHVGPLVWVSGTVIVIRVLLPSLSNPEKRVGSSIDISVAGLTAMRNT